jgi:membrane-associated phospholipid phosphatase
MVATLEVPQAEAWPLHRRDALALLAWYVGIVAVFTAVGAALTGPFGGSRLVHVDEDISRWFADGRKATFDDLAIAGRTLAETYVKIAVTLLVAAIVYAAWRAWRDVLMIVLPLVLEAASFITITWLVGRPRPDVPRLEVSPVASSFPSGHAAAATAYGAIAIVVWWRTENRVVRALAVVVVVAVPLIVAWARTYAGMHHLTDVVAGILLGAVSVLAVWLLLRDRQ